MDSIKDTSMEVTHPFVTNMLQDASMIASLKDVPTIAKTLLAKTNKGAE
jgi:hypothetical protein